MHLVHIYVSESYLQDSRYLQGKFGTQKMHEVDWRTRLALKLVFYVLPCTLTSGSNVLHDT